MCGAWVAMEGGEEGLVEVVRELLEKTDLSVRRCVLSGPQLCHTLSAAGNGGRDSSGGC